MGLYGTRSDGVLDESSPRHRIRTPYGDAKLDAETIARDMIAPGLRLSMLQRTVVYGRFGPNRCTEPLRQQLGTRYVPLDDGAGYFNAVLVDDLLNDIVLAAVKPSAVGESFLILGKDACRRRAGGIDGKCQPGQCAALHVQLAQANRQYEKSSRLFLRVLDRRRHGHHRAVVSMPAVAGLDSPEPTQLREVRSSAAGHVVRVPPTRSCGRPALLRLRRARVFPRLERLFRAQINVHSAMSDPRHKFDRTDLHGSRALRSVPHHRGLRRLILDTSRRMRTLATDAFPPRCADDGPSLPSR